MTFDLLLRLLSIAMTPMITLLIFVLQDGRRRARLAKRAKTAAELVNVAPKDSPLLIELVKNYERATKAYLHAHRPRRFEWSSLTEIIATFVVGLLFVLLG